MADKQVNLKLSASEAGFTAAIDKARDRLNAFGGTVAQQKARMETFQAALDESGASTAKQVQEIQKAIAQMDRLATTTGKNTAELQAYKAATLGITESTKGYVSDIAAAGQHAHDFGLKTAAARREVVVLAHELSQGNFKKFGGSLMVLGEQWDVLSKITPKIIGIGAAFATLGIAAEITLKAKEALAEYGEQVETLHAKTGVSVATIQEWTFATTAAGLQTKEATKSLTDLAAVQNKALGGNKDAAAAFAAVGVSLKDLKSASPESLLATIADAFHNSADGASKAAVANELFGASGADLIPLLNKGSEGLAELRKQADATGGVLSDNTVKQMVALKEQMDLAKARMDALSMSAKTQLLPTIINLTDALGDNAAMKPILEDFYKGVGVIMRSAASAVATLVVGFEQTAEVVATLATVVGYGLTGQFKLAAAAAEVGYDHLKQQGKGYSEFMTKLWDNTVPKAPDTHNAQGPALQFHKGNNGEHKQKSNENALNGAIAEQATAIAKIENARKDALSQAKADFDTGRRTYEDYYKQVHDINAKAYDEEVALAEKRVELAKQKKQIAAAQTAQKELDKLVADRKKVETDYTNALEELAEKRRKAVDKYRTQQQASIQKQGDGFRAQDATRFMDSYQVADYNAQAKLYENYLQERAKLKEQYDSKQVDLQTYQDKQEIADQAYAVELSQLTAHLQQEKALRESFSAQMGLQLKQLSGNGQTAAQTMAQGFSTVWSTANSTLESFVTAGKFSFSSFTASILSDLAKIALRMAEMSIFKSASMAMGFSTGGAVGHYADGGHIVGEGTGTSDSIPAMLSNGEFVVNAASTKKYRSLLESINSGQAQHFATGGAVGSSSGGSSGGSVTNLNLSLSGNGGGLTQEDLMALAPMFQALIDKRMAQNMRSQGGYAYQMRYNQV